MNCTKLYKQEHTKHFYNLQFYKHITQTFFVQFVIMILSPIHTRNNQMYNLAVHIISKYNFSQIKKTNKLGKSVAKLGVILSE